MLETQTAGHTDVIVIGAGLAGLMAAIHAVQAGATVRVIAHGWGQQSITPGWISVCDQADYDVLDTASQVAAQRPGHPYARAGVDALRHSLEHFRAFTAQIGLPYDLRGDGCNLRVMTLLGAIQTPLLAPRGLANGDLTVCAGPILIVGFAGWRDFYPELAVANLSRQGIAARAIMLDLPQTPSTWDLWPNDLAQHMEHSEFRQELIAQLRPHIDEVEKIGFPAVLGLAQHTAVIDDLSTQLERPCFEIPTLPPSIPGTRLTNRLRHWLLRHQARVQIGHLVRRGIMEQGRCVGVEVAALGHTNAFYADHVILASGGLYNGGLQSDEAGRVWEPIFDLQVTNPFGNGRADWFAEILLTPTGHPIYQTGVRVDAHLRPLNTEGAPAFENVYAAGHLLGGFNPLTDGCTEGAALATAYRAAQIILGLESERQL